MGKVMKHNLVVVSGLTMLISVLLTGCGEKSIAYYAAHPVEATQRLVECQKLDLKVQIGEIKCTNPQQGYAIYYTTRLNAADKRDSVAIEALGKSNK
jgi:hypothetical protein